MTVAKKHDSPEFNMETWKFGVCQVARRLHNQQFKVSPGSRWGLCRGVCPKMVIKCHEFMGESPFVIGTYHDLGITGFMGKDSVCHFWKIGLYWTRHILDIYSIQVPCEFLMATWPAFTLARGISAEQWGNVRRKNRWDFHSVHFRFWHVLTAWIRRAVFWVADVFLFKM